MLCNVSFSMSPEASTDLIIRSLGHGPILGLSCLLSLLVLTLASVTRSRLRSPASVPGCGDLLTSVMAKPEDTSEERIHEDEFIYISKKCDNTMMWNGIRYDENIDVFSTLYQCRFPWELIYVCISFWACMHPNKRLEKNILFKTLTWKQNECNCNKTWTLNEIKIWIWIEASFYWPLRLFLSSNPQHKHERTLCLSDLLQCLCI